MKLDNAFIAILAVSVTPLVHAQSPTEPPRVNITKNITQIKIRTDSRTVVIERDQDPFHTIPPPFDKTSRPCPPFCIQPHTAAPGVVTLGELELIEFLQKTATSDRVLIIDTRLPEWYQRGTIPLAINLPVEDFRKDLPHILEQHLDAKQTGNRWDFSNAKTLVLFDNGHWNPDSRQAIELLVNQGYPAENLKWYRGGMQAWLSLGLTTEKPE